MANRFLLVMLHVHACLQPQLRFPVGRIPANVQSLLSAYALPQEAAEDSGAAHECCHK
jgi:hypothetical protein